MIEIEVGTRLAPVLRSHGLPSARPVIVLIGGANGLDPSVADRFRSIFTQQLFPLISSFDGIVVDGGTDAGLMRVAGDAYAAAGSTFPLVGVVPRGKAPSATGPAVGTGTRLESRHTHHIVVPGQEWGEESVWMFDIADALAGGRPRVTVLVDGGELAMREVMLAVTRGHHALIVEGSGRTADELSEASRTGRGGPEASLLLSTGRVQIVSEDGLPTALRHRLSAPGAADTRTGPDLSQLIDRLDLAPLQKELLRSRWLEQLEWLTARANRARRWYQRFHLATVVGGLLVPALVSYSLGTPNAPEAIRFLTFAVSLVVAITAALEEVFHFGDVWRQYRSTAETLKSEGWEFVFLTGPYAGYQDHAEAYQPFSGRIESVLRQDVSGYFERVFVTSPRDRKPPGVVIR